MKKLLTVSTLLFLDLFIVASIENDWAKWMFAGLSFASLVWLIKEMIEPMPVPLSSRSISEGTGWVIASLSLLAFKVLSNSFYSSLHGNVMKSNDYLVVSCSFCFSFMILSFSIGCSWSENEFVNAVAIISSFLLFLMAFFFSLFLMAFLYLDGLEYLRLAE